jgi:hypothetical protein
MAEDIKAYLAASIGEVGMAWGHVQRALLHCRRTGRQDISQVVVDLNRIGNELTAIEDQLRAIFQASTR